MIFESFTASAERALERALRLARHRKAELVEPLDLLAALARSSRKAAPRRCWANTAWRQSDSGQSSGQGERKSLRRSGSRARRRCRRRIPSLRGSLPLSPALRLVVNEAMAQARGLDRKREVGTEHLLAGLLSSLRAGRRPAAGGRPGI